MLLHTKGYRRLAQPHVTLSFKGDLIQATTRRDLSLSRPFSTVCGGFGLPVISLKNDYPFCPNIDHLLLFDKKHGFQLITKLFFNVKNIGRIQVNSYIEQSFLYYEFVESPKFPKY